MNSQSIALARPAAGWRHHGHDRGRGSFKRFFLHFGEMTVAMVIGMIIGMGFLPDLLRIPATATEAQTLLMAASMSVPMVSWMRVRGHSWRSSAEMTAAMVVPAVALLVPLWVGVFSGDTVIVLQHVAMLPSMLVVMVYRRNEYGL